MAVLRSLQTLGQTDVATLRAYGLPDAIINSLIPYIGLKIFRAIAKLAQSVVVKYIKCFVFNSFSHLSF